MKRRAGLFFRLFVLLAVTQTIASAETYTRTIYLVRHGHYDSKPEAGPDGPGLSSLGIAQARLIASRLHAQPVVFTSLTASTLTRARETALIVNQSLPGLTLQTSPLLRECTPRSWNAAVLKQEKMEDMLAAETQLNGAFAQFFTPATRQEEHDILVCHGNVIRYFVCKALGVDTQAWLGFSVAHASLTIIQISPEGKFKVLAVGDAGHIAPNLQSGATRLPDPLLVAP